MIRGLLSQVTEERTGSDRGEAGAVLKRGVLLRAVTEKTGPDFGGT